jgi:hypothetical protein
VAVSMKVTVVSRISDRNGVRIFLSGALALAMTDGSVRIGD